MADIQTGVSLAISVLRARHGRTQGWLAEALGVSPATISHRMNGRTKWDTDDIEEIAKAFDLSPFDLIRVADTEAHPEKVPA